MTAIDAFGDLDQHPSVRVVSLAGAFTARAARSRARSVECDAVVYLASFENHPNAVSALAEGRALWGNPPEVSAACAIRCSSPRRFGSAGFCRATRSG